MELLTVLVSGFILLATLYYLLVPKREKNFPPGPDGIPIFGNAFQIRGFGHKRVMEMTKKYGNIIGLYVGSYRFVYLNDPADMREAFGRPDFTARGGYNPFLDVNCEDVNAGIVMSSGNLWQEHRRFTLRTLRDFGFGKRSLEGIIQEEVDGLMEQFRKVEGQPISTPTRFNIAAFNVIWSIVAGQRFPLDDPRLKELITYLNDFFQAKVELVRFFCFIFSGWARFVTRHPRLFPSQRDMFRQKLIDFLKKTIDEHRATREDGTAPRDFIDSYMDEGLKNEGNESSSFKLDGDDYKLIVTLMDIFGAGGETTSSTLTWSFFLLALHPEVQEKMYKEIIEAGASDRSVTLSDRPNLNYAEAVMAEIFRISTLAPVAIPHSPTEDVIFKGFTIPKGTLVFSNIYAAHFDEKIWGDPNVFRPERHLTGSGKSSKFNRNNALLPFSVGKRECLGMTLAKDEFYLFLTNSVRNFVITMPPDEPPHTFDGQLGLVVTPEPHQIILKSR